MNSMSTNVPKTNLAGRWVRGGADLTSEERPRMTFDGSEEGYNSDPDSDLEEKLTQEAETTRITYDARTTFRSTGSPRNSFASTIKRLGRISHSDTTSVTRDSFGSTISGLSFSEKDSTWDGSHSFCNGKEEISMPNALKKESFSFKEESVLVAGAASILRNRATSHTFGFFDVLTEVMCENSAVPKTAKHDVSGQNLQMGMRSPRSQSKPFAGWVSSPRDSENSKLEFIDKIFKVEGPLFKEHSIISKTGFPTEWPEDVQTISTCTSRASSSTDWSKAAQSIATSTSRASSSMEWQPDLMKEYSPPKPSTSSSSQPKQWRQNRFVRKGSSSSEQ